MSYAAREVLAAGHIASFQIHPRKMASPRCGGDAVWLGRWDVLPQLFDAADEGGLVGRFEVGGAGDKDIGTVRSAELGGLGGDTAVDL